MALTDGNTTGMTMPVVPMYGGGFGNGGGFCGGFGGDWGWIILLLLLGWGNNGNGFGGGFGGGNDLYPWLNNSQNINDGFRDSMLNDSVTSIRDGISALSTQLCNCCGDMQMTVANGFAQAEIADNARQIANMQQAFAAQTAMSQGFNATQAQLAQCCCDNRLATANLSALVQSENCADRAALSDGIRDIIVSQTANTQRILDQLCNDKIDSKNEKIADLERQLTMANLAASQTAQTTRILQGQTAEVDALYDRLASCPVGTMPVYGNQPIFTCPQNTNNGCGCGCGNF